MILSQASQMYYFIVHVLSFLRTGLHQEILHPQKVKRALHAVDDWFIKKWINSVVFVEMTKTLSHCVCKRDDLVLFYYSDQWASLQSPPSHKTLKDKHRTCSHYDLVLLTLLLLVLGTCIWLFVHPYFCSFEFSEYSRTWRNIFNDFGHWCSFK